NAVAGNGLAVSLLFPNRRKFHEQHPNIKRFQPAVSLPSRRWWGDAILHHEPTTEWSGPGQSTAGDADCQRPAGSHRCDPCPPPLPGQGLASTAFALLSIAGACGASGRCRPHDSARPPLLLAGQQVLLHGVEELADYRPDVRVRLALVLGLQVRQEVFPV